MVRDGSMNLDLKLKLMFWEVVKKYLSDEEKVYVLETGDFPALGIYEEFIIGVDGKVYGKREIVRPIWLGYEP